MENKIFKLKQYAQEQFNGKCLSDVYFNNHYKYTWECQSGHVWEASWMNISRTKKPSRCPDCYGNRKHTIEEVRAVFAKMGWTLISDKFKNTDSKLLAICAKGHSVETTLHTIKSGHGCSSCSSTRKKTFEEIKEFYASAGWTVLSTQYENTKSTLSLICPKGHKTKTCYNSTQQGRQCKKCAKVGKYDYQDVQEYLDTFGYKLISQDYLHCREELEMLCPNGHTSYIKFVNFKFFNSRCRTCFPTGSVAENDVFEFVKKFYPNAIKCKFKDIGINSKFKNKELDIYIPELKIAIEYCGLYWHSEAIRQDKNEHYNKYIECKKNGVRLITLFEDEWVCRNEQTKNFLISVLKANANNINGRDCEVREITKEKAKDFVEKTHIQGLHSCLVAFGLFHNEELVGVITGANHHRKNDNKELILQRLCFKFDTTVRGGASKLVNKLKEYAKANNYTRLVSWSDNRFSEGNVYIKTGFTLEGETAVDYFYTKPSKVPYRVSKQSLKKTKEEQTSGKTEAELRHEEGYSRIWDCGKKRWTLSL